MYIIYLRKSRQDDASETVEQVLNRHEKQLQEYAKKTFGYYIDEDNIYREVVSGETIEDRIEIKKVFDRIQNDNIEGCLVIEPSRLTRGDLLDLGTVVHIFRYTNTPIITPTKTYNLEDKYDRKFFEMELTRGSDYLDYTKEILNRGRYASAHEGNYIGGTAPYGYEKIKIGKSPTLKIIPEQAQVIRMIFNWYLHDNMGYSAIANKLNDLGYKTQQVGYFTAKTICKILHNPIYIGKVKYKERPIVKVYEDGKLKTKRIYDKNCELIEGKHEAIITEHQFKMVQERSKNNVKIADSSKLSNMFSGILYCGVCGRSMAYKKRGAKPARYECRNYHRCDCTGSDAEAIFRAIIEALQTKKESLQVIVESQDKDLLIQYENDIKTLESQLTKLDVKQAQLYDFLEEGIYTSKVFIERSELINAERERITITLNELKNKKPSVDDFKNKITDLDKCIALIKNNREIDIMDINIFLKSVISKITYTKTAKGTPHKYVPFTIKVELL